MLRDQLGPRLIAEARANFDAPIFDRHRGRAGTEKQTDPGRRSGKPERKARTGPHEDREDRRERAALPACHQAWRRSPRREIEAAAGSPQPRLECLDGARRPAGKPEEGGSREGCGRRGAGKDVATPGLEGGTFRQDGPRRPWPQAAEITRSRHGHETTGSRRAEARGGEKLARPPRRSGPRGKAGSRSAGPAPGRPGAGHAAAGPGKKPFAKRSGGGTQAVPAAGKPASRSGGSGPGRPGTGHAAAGPGKKPFAKRSGGGTQAAPAAGKPASRSGGSGPGRPGTGHGAAGPGKKPFAKRSGGGKPAAPAAGKAGSRSAGPGEPRRGEGGRPRGQGSGRRGAPPGADRRR